MALIFEEEKINSFILLPVVEWLLLFRLFTSIECWRVSFLSASVIWGILVTGTVEILSISNGLTPTGIRIAWTFYLLISFTLLVATRRHNSKKEAALFSLKILKEYEKSILIMYGGIFFVICITGIIGVISAPNNWDSMTYHMARVAHWTQNNSISHYPTYVLRQLHQPPWAEYAVLNLQMVNGNDRFANMVQWFSMIGSVIGVSLVAKQINETFWAQLLSSVICVTLPMGILQSSSTQNDYVVSFWIISFLYFFIDTIIISKKNICIGYLKVGACFGLAILTKGTAYIYLFPFITVFVFLVKANLQRLGKMLVVIFLMTFVLNGGHYLRNFGLFGTPVPKSGNYTNETLDFSLLLSNIFKNIALHISTPFPFYNKNIQEGIYSLFQELNIDVNDPRVTWPDQKLIIQIPSNSEDTAGNTLHLLLAIYVSFVWAIKPKLRDGRLCSSVLLTLGCCFLIFSFVLKWQPWGSRLQLPFFVLFSVITGTVLSTVHGLRQHLFGFTFLVCSTPWCLFNFSRPLFLNIDKLAYKKNHEIKIVNTNIFNISREEQYFIPKPEFQKSYFATYQFVKKQNCENLGIAFGNDELMDYPFFVFFNSDRKRRLEHIMVDNVSAEARHGLKDESFKPCIILSLKSTKDKLIKFNGMEYILSNIDPPINLYTKK